MDSWAGASTSLNLWTSGIASVCIAASRPEQSHNTHGVSEARNRAEQGLRTEGAAGGRVTYDDEDLGDWASFGSHAQSPEVQDIADGSGAAVVAASGGSAARINGLRIVGEGEEAT